MILYVILHNILIAVYNFIGSNYFEMTRKKLSDVNSRFMKKYNLHN